MSGCPAEISMMPRDDDDPIYKVQTVPPPPGATDAYSAPTRVGEMSASVLDEMLVAARTRGAAQRAGDGTPEEQPPSVVVPVPSSQRFAPEPLLASRPAFSPSPAPSHEAHAARGQWHIVLRAAFLLAALLTLAVLAGTAVLLLRP